MIRRSPIVVAAVLLWFAAPPAFAVQSVARQWNEALLTAIRNDLARPTVTARNLFHFSVAAYDAWAAYDREATPYLLGKTVGGFTCPFAGAPAPADTQAARKEAISYAAYRLLRERFQTSPGASLTLPRLDSLMTVLGYDPAFTSTDYASGSPAALGNYIGQSIIAFGLQDGSNEQNNYAYQYYQPVNPAMIVQFPGDSTLVDPNRWQPLTLTVFIDQNGNVIPGNTPKFLTPEWGNVTPFALGNGDLTIHSRDGSQYKVYDDPGPPPMLDVSDGTDAASALYKWAFELVLVWSSHLKGSDPVLWDISPASIGNNGPLPENAEDLPSFYNLLEGGDHGTRRCLDLGQDRGRSPRRSRIRAEPARHLLEQIAAAQRAIFGNPEERLQPDPAGHRAGAGHRQPSGAQLRDRSIREAQHRRHRHQLDRRPDPVDLGRQMAAQGWRRAKAVRRRHHFRLDRRNAVRHSQQEPQRGVQT